MNKTIIYSIQAILLSYSIIGTQAYSEEGECVTAQKTLSDITELFEKDKINLELSIEFRKIFEDMKSEFDTMYYKFMASQFSEIQGVVFKSIELKANLLLNLLSYHPAANVTNSVIYTAIDCTSGVIKSVLNDIVSGLISGHRSVKSVMRDATMEGMKCGTISSIPKIGGELDLVQNLVNDIKDIKNISSEHKEAVVEMNRAISRIDNYIKKYQGEIDYSKYMINQYDVVKSELESILNKCEKDNKEVNSSPGFIKFDNSL